MNFTTNFGSRRGIWKQFGKRYKKIFFFRGATMLNTHTGINECGEVSLPRWRFIKDDGCFKEI